jgi:hypothetical protein
VQLAPPGFRLQGVDATQRACLEGLGTDGEVGEQRSESVSHGSVEST